jgi:hypothetical protein
MIPHKKEIDFQSSGLTNQVKAYTFQMNAHMASLLSDTLYSDKPTACWRELVANAYDSHKDAGNPDPPVIHMCTALEPWIEIADQGVGLDEVEFEEVFTSYGGSTKRDTNITVGNKGLGSKVFFAYTSQATIVCVKDGIKRVFSIFKDDTGMPSHNKLSEQPTNEPNGVELSFGILPGDIGTFQEAAKQVFRRYNPTPIIKGMDDFVPESYETIMKGQGWVLRKEETEGYMPYGQRQKKSQPYAIQGNIAYPISPEVESGLDEKVKFMLEVPFDITFPIGQLETANSREALSYNQQTIDNIAVMFLKIYNEISNDIMPQVFTNCTTEWEAVKALADFIGEIDNTKYKKLVQSVAQWNGNPVSSELVVSWTAYNKDESILNRHVQAYAMGERRFSLQTMNIAPDQINNYNDITLVGKRKYIILISKGNEKRIPSRLKQYMFNTYGEAHKRSRYTNVDKDQYPVVILLKLPQAASIITFTKLLGGHEWHMFDKIIPEYATVRAARGSAATRGPVNRRVMKFTGRDNRYDSQYKMQWDVATINTSVQTTGYYVDLRHWQVKSNSEFVSHYNIYTLVELAKVFKIPCDTVYGVPGGQKNELEPLPGWLELTSEIDRIQKEWEDAKTTPKEITYNKVYGNNNRIGNLSDYFNKHNITDQGAIQVFLARSPLDTTTKLHYHIRLTNKDINELYNQQLADTIENEFKTVNTKYPMLQHMGLDMAEADDIKAYVKLVGNQP